MRLFDKKLSLSLELLPIIGLAIGRTKSRRYTHYLIYILCISIQLEIETIYENQYIPHKKITTPLANRMFLAVILLAIATGLSMYYSLNYETLLFMPVMLLVSTFILGFAYLLMPENEKYY